MPTLTRWFVKSALIYLALGLIALWSLPAARMGLVPDWMTLWRPAYIHLFTLGWLSQLIFGIAHWMLPMHTKEQPRGNETLVWGTWITINIGLILRLIAEPFATQHPHTMWGWVLVISALLQWVGALLFVVNTWPRVKPRRVGGRR